MPTTSGSELDYKSKTFNALAFALRDRIRGAEDSDDSSVSGSTDNPTQNVSNQAHAEREKYLKTVKVDITANPLTFWEANKNDFPTLSELARNYLGTPATSATSEREFKVGKLITKERIRLLPKNVESLLFLKYNLRALKYNIDLPRAPVHFKPPNSIQYDELEFQEESNLE